MILLFILGLIDSPIPADRQKKRGLFTVYLFSWYRQTPYVQIQVKAHAMSAGINFVLLERFFNLAISENKNVHKLTLFILCL